MSEMKNGPVVGVTDEIDGLRRAVWRLSGSGMSFTRFWQVYGDKLDGLTKTTVSREAALSPGKVSDDWVRDAAMNVMLATEVDEATRILRAALEAAQLPARPVVKPLNWGKTSYGRPEVATVVGVYRVHEHVSGGWGATFRSTCLVDQYGRQNFATEAGAIAACEADYERRIRSALEGEGE